MTLKAKCTCPPWRDPERYGHMPWCTYSLTPPLPKDEPMPDLPIRKTTLNEVELTIDDLKKMLGIEPTAKVHVVYTNDESTGVQRIGSIFFAWYVKEEG
jgi:hypothetical protein